MFFLGGGNSIIKQRRAKSNIFPLINPRAQQFFFNDSLVASPLPHLDVLQHEHPRLRPLAGDPAPPGPRPGAAVVPARPAGVVGGVGVVAGGQQRAHVAAAAAQLQLGNLDGGKNVNDFLKNSNQGRKKILKSHTSLKNTH